MKTAPVEKCSDSGKQRRSPEMKQSQKGVGSHMGEKEFWKEYIQFVTHCLSLNLLFMEDQDPTTIPLMNETGHDSQHAILFSTKDCAIS